MGTPSARIGDMTSGHPEFPPTMIASGNAKVLIEGLPASCVGDAGIPHIRLSKPFDPHEVKISAGSSKVMIGGKPAARVGDSTACGGAIASGASKVLIG